jgi:hypothetical protein
MMHNKHSQLLRIVCFALIFVWTHFYFFQGSFNSSNASNFTFPPSEPPQALSLETKPEMSFTCNKRVMIVFTGPIRGDNCSWQVLFNNLVLYNDADVVIDVWNDTPEREQLLKSIFRPCLWFSEPYDNNYVSRMKKLEPRFEVVEGFLHVTSKGETGLPNPQLHVVDQYYRMYHAFNLIGQRDSVIVRARLDQFFLFPLKIPAALVQPNFLYILDDPGSPSCPLTINDMFAYGKYDSMQSYFNVFPNLITINNEMKAHPGYTVWWENNNVAKIGGFINNPETFLGWNVQKSNVSCSWAKVFPMWTREHCVVRQLQNAQWQCDCNSYPSALNANGISFM